jgi:monoamine oxidase
LAHDEFDVVVVGAGAAGLAAAQRLGASGLSHLVVEARDRPGGRAWTVQLANGEAADLGCGWLHSAETNPLAGVAERQGLTLDK